jgi:alkylation response protein AidB-like acyl-CoA dehydrogenase
MGKLLRSELIQKIQDLSAQIIGPYSQLMRDSAWAVLGGEVGYHVLASRGGTIAAGTSEIQRNIIAERVLGLPR